MLAILDDENHREFIFWKKKTAKDMGFVFPSEKQQHLQRFCPHFQSRVITK